MGKKTSNINKTEMKNFITYFQSVTTIGIVSRAKTAKEAEGKSTKRLKNSSVSCGIINQTPYTISDTDQWEIDCQHSSSLLKNK